MNLRRFAVTLVLALAALASTAHAALPPSLSGSWFDPVHAGHGFSIEMLAGERAIAYWFVYDAQGAPVHLYLDGRVEGRTISGPAYAARGMRFGTFDPATRSLGHWGTLSIRFDSCTQARLRYDANGPAGGPQFGSGDIALTRLSSIGELECAPNTFPEVPTGLYRGTRSDESDAPLPMRGLVDRAGRLWATSVAINSLAGSSGPYAPVIIGRTPLHADSNVVAPALHYESFVPDGAGREPDRRAILLKFDGDRVSASLTPWTLTFYPELELSLYRDAAATARVDREWNLPALFRRTFVFDVDAGASPRWAVRLAGYSFCLEPERSTACTWFGEIVVPEPGRSVFTFALRGPAQSGAPSAQSEPIRYRGTGWIEWNGDEPAELVLVSDGPLGIVAHLQN